MTATWHGFDVAEKQAPVVRELLFGYGIGDHDHEPTGFRDLYDVRIRGEGGGDQLGPTLANGLLGGGLMPEMVFVDDSFEYIRRWFGGALDLTPRFGGFDATKITDQFFR